MPKQLSSQMVTVTEGLVSNVSDLLRGTNQAKVLNNVRQLKRGVFTTTQNGWTRQRTDTFNSGAAFSEFSVFVDNDGLRTLVFQVGDSLFSYDGTTETLIQDTLGETYAPCMRMFSPYASGSPIMVYVNGEDDPLQVGAVDMATTLDVNGATPWLTGAPLPVKSYEKPLFCETFLDRMVYAGFKENNADTSMDILITNAGAFDTVAESTPLVATDGGIFTIPARLGAITALRVLKLTNQTNDQILVVGCAAGVAIILGHDALDFQMRILTDEYGIVSNRAIVTIMNDLFFLANDGVRRFSGLANNATFLNATMTFGQQDIIRRINIAQASKAFASHHRLTQEVEFWFPLDENTTCNAALVANYNTDASSYESVEPIWTTRDGTTVACMIDFNGVDYGGGYDGILQVHHSGNLYDTAPVKWTITPSFMSPGDAMYDCQIDQMLVITEGASQQFAAVCHFYQDMGGTKAIQRTLAEPQNQILKALNNDQTILGSWQLGLSAFAPGPGVKLLPFRPRGKGRWWEIELSGSSGDQVIDFIGVQYRFVAGDAKP